MSALGNLPSPSGADAAPADTIVLEDGHLRAVFDRQYGSLLTLENKQTGWRVQDRSQFGAGFRMHVPLPERRTHFVTEKENPLESAETHAGMSGVTFLWSKLKSPHAGTLDITLRASVSLSGSGLLVTTDVDNRSGLSIESLAYPILGDISIPSHSNGLSQGVWGYAGMDKTELFPNFSNRIGYWGPDYPTQQALSPTAQFVLIFADSEGLYAGYHDAQAQTLAGFQFQLEPGYADSLMGAAEDATLRKDFSRINFQVIQFLFATPGQRKSSPPIVLQPYKGSWHAGADIYKEWRKTWFKPPVSPAWVNDVHSWQQIQINSAEDSLLFPYKQLVEYGKDCARHGVKAIQLTGWNRGGQDRGNPSHETDPRLGTTEELREAIEACRKMGVEVILFNKYTWSDSSTEWYRNELFRYAARDPYGDTYQGVGYNYDTPTQLAGINTRHLIPMCTACPAWREIAFKEFHKSVELGAGGILQDEVAWHGPGVYYCFSADHGHAVPAFVFSGDLPLAEGLRKQIDPERFLMAGEALWDLQSRFYKLGYFRISGAEHIALQRYIDPSLPLMVAATAWNDRQMINRCLLYRYVMSYEPYGFKGRLDDFPLTIEYGKKVDALRRKYKAYLWDGEFRDTLGATVMAGGKPHSQYSVFVNNSTGRRALVIVNPSDSDEMLFDISLPDPRQLSVVTPEIPEPKDFAGRLRVPAESAAALLEI
jgi:hypothetical protein